MRCAAISLRAAPDIRISLQQGRSDDMQKQTVASRILSLSAPDAALDP